MFMAQHPSRRVALLASMLAMLAAPAHAKALGYDIQALPARPPAPKLLLQDINGKPWRLSDLRGKVVLLNFWASWCAPCRIEMPALQALANAPGDDRVVVLAVNFKESPAAIARFVQTTGLTLPVVADEQGLLAKQFGVTIFPSTVVIDRSGQPRHRVRGEFDWQAPAAHALLKPLRSP